MEVNELGPGSARRAAHRARRQRRIGAFASGLPPPEPRAGTWHVYGSDASTPMCQRTNETDAEAAAQWLAQMTGASRVVIHDRYHRTHLSATAPRSA